MQIFDRIAWDNTADIASGCQMMSYSHIEKYLNGNKHSNFNVK